MPLYKSFSILSCLFLPPLYHHHVPYKPEKKSLFLRLDLKIDNSVVHFVIGILNSYYA